MDAIGFSSSSSGGSVAVDSESTQNLSRVILADWGCAEPQHISVAYDMSSNWYRSPDLVCEGNPMKIPKASNE